MPKRLIRLEGEPLFNLWSYARPGLSARDRLSPPEIEQITLTVKRTPEVMVKVLTRGGQGLKAIRGHLSYLNRGGDLDIETDDGERLKGEGVESDLLSDWDLELEEDRGRSKLGPRDDRAPPKMVHKLLFSMPPGTPPLKVLDATRNFAREEFALQHRYAMVLHTDEAHPHVHLVVKATSEEGRRLNIRKATLREWRTRFARHLRALGVPANATQRHVRGETFPRKPDGIYRANLRGQSTHMWERVQSIARGLATGDLGVESAKPRLVHTREQVRRTWQKLGDRLLREGYQDLSAQVYKFANQMPAAQTEREWLTTRLVKRANEPHTRASPTR